METEEIISKAINAKKTENTRWAVRKKWQSWSQNVVCISAFGVSARFCFFGFYIRAKMKMMLHPSQLWSSCFIVWVCTVLTWGRSTIHNSISLLCKQGRNINPSWTVFCANFELVNLKECNTRILQQIILNYKEVTYTFQCVELIAKPG